MTAGDAPAPPDARRFREAMGRFATGVAVVVVPAGDEVVAMTVNAVSSVSLDPMLVLFCPSHKSRFAQHMAGLEHFSINFLRHDQETLSTYFAGTWKQATPPSFRFVPGACAPRLEGSLASLQCARERVLDAGDHWVVIGRVLELYLGAASDEPLLFFGGRYRTLDRSESTPAPDLADVHDEPAHVPYERR